MIVLVVTLLLQVALAPAPLVERFVTVGDTSVRLSLFDNRMAVLSVRHRDERTLLRKRTLDETSFAVYVNAVAELRDAAAAGRGPSSERGIGTAEIRVSREGRDPVVIHYTPGTVLDLPTGRLVGVLDDLEEQLRTTPESYEALRAWDPRRGDVVELYTGEAATVQDVADDGLVVLRHQRTGMVEYVPFEARAQVIRSVVSTSE